MCESPLSPLPTLCRKKKKKKGTYFCTAFHTNNSLRAVLAGHSQHKHFPLMLLVVTTSPSASSWKPCWAAILPGKMKVKSSSTAYCLASFTVYCLASSTVSISNFVSFFPSLALSCFLPRYCQYTHGSWLAWQTLSYYWNKKGTNM